MLRRRHFPFKVGRDERDGADATLRCERYDVFVKVADHMRNHDESTHVCEYGTMAAGIVSKQRHLPCQR